MLIVENGIGAVASVALMGRIKTAMLAYAHPRSDTEHSQDFTPVC